MKQKNKLRYKGFTLVELVTVLGILAMFSGVTGYFMLNWLPKYRLKKAALTLFSDFQTARMKAIKSGSRYAVVFHTDTNQYQIVGAGDDRVFNDEPGSGSGSDDDWYGETVNLPAFGSGIAFGHGNAARNATTTGNSNFPEDGVSYAGNSAEFNSQGMANKMGYVYLENNMDDAFAISTPTMAGVVTLKRWNGSEWR